MRADAPAVVARVAVSGHEVSGAVLLPGRAVGADQAGATIAADGPLPTPARGRLCLPHGLPSVRPSPAPPTLAGGRCSFWRAAVVILCPTLRARQGSFKARREEPERVGGLDRDDGISKRSKSVHPEGKPISASTKRGLRAIGCEPFEPALRITWAGREGEPLRPGMSSPFQSRAFGVDHIAAWPSSVNVGSVVPPAARPFTHSPRAAFGVCHIFVWPVKLSFEPGWFPQDSASSARGVDHVEAQEPRLGVPLLGRECGTTPSFCELPYGVALGVG